MRQTLPVYYDEQIKMWYAFRYEDVQQVLADIRSFSSAGIQGDSYLEAMFGVPYTALTPASLQHRSSIAPASLQHRRAPGAEGVSAVSGFCPKLGRLSEIRPKPGQPRLRSRELGRGAVLAPGAAHVLARFHQTCDPPPASIEVP